VDACGPICHALTMNNRRSPIAGGIFLFLGPVIGAVYGVDRGAPVQWMLAGFGIGLTFAIAIWLIDRRKR
jgi:cyanate permease